ncbi:MAG: prepilin-type N-terminal cleavage/methylation domain-containing protein, partial [bacterium]|nr:prepilin-type N-terminal cleavage/methylation domain-containing protein [bacterium]
RLEGKMNKKAMPAGRAGLPAGRQGFTLIETLVAVTIFAIVGILSTRAIMLSVQGSKKGSSSVTVRENLNYSLGVIERLLRNADDISTCTLAPDTINYHDQNGKTASFSCGSDADGNFVASGSARLTSSEIDVTSCAISCDLTSVPPSVTINVTAGDVATGSTKEGAQISISSKINLRTY